MVAIVEFLAQAIKDKPTDGSDCKTLESAQKELGRLRRATAKVVKALSNAQDLAGQNGAVAPAPGDDDGRKTKEKKAEKRKLHRKALTIDQSFKAYKKVAVEKSSEDRALIKSAIKNNSLFNSFRNAELDEFVDVFAPKTVSAGTTIIKQGEQGHTFYVVQSGSLDIFINMGQGDKVVETQVGVPYERGGAFGELALLYDSPRAATIRASEDSVLWEISRKAFKGLQLHIEQSAHDLRIDQLRNVKIGKKLLGQVMDVSQLESMAMAMTSQKFEAGSTIVKEGETGNTFYVIVDGTVDVYKESAGGKVASLGVNSFFGEKALLSSDTRQATCIAATSVECLTLARNDFNLILGNLQDVMAGRRMSMLQKSAVMTPSFYKKEDNKAKITLKDLKVKRTLGEGAFGKVVLVKSKIDGELYALKAQGKANIIETKFEDKLITEYRMMRDLSHPFLVQCYNGYQDTKYIYFLMGLLPGGELLDLLEQYDKFPESWTRFYCGAVVLVYDFLHQQKIAYRDLKPENLVLDADGYCHVVDLGLAKYCKNGRTWTMCGTPDYLAPEVITGKGHDWAVDYWALGVLLYELTHGLPPFYDENPSNTPKKVMKGQYDIPQNFSRPLVDLVSHLLTDQTHRLGRIQGGVRRIRKHNWFGDFDWQGLLDRKMEVPWKPELGNLEKLGSKFDGVWDAPDSDWEPALEAPSQRQSWDPKRSATFSRTPKKFNGRDRSASMPVH